MSRTVRAAALAVITFAGLTLPMVATAPAYADDQRCVDFLEQEGYPADEAITAECDTGETGDIHMCLDGLIGKRRVESRVAMIACLLAERPEGESSDA